MLYSFSTSAYAAAAAPTSLNVSSPSAAGLDPLCSVAESTLAPALRLRLRLLCATRPPRAGTTSSRCFAAGAKSP